MPYSNISAVMTPSEETAINDGLDAVPANMPYAVSLTPKERMAMPGVDDRRYEFVTECMEQARAHPELVPGFRSLVEAEKDLKLFNDLRPIEAKAAHSLKIISDTKRAVGSELYSFCLDFYRTVSRASKSNVIGSTAVKDALKVQFQGQGNRNSEEVSESSNSGGKTE